MSVPVVLAWKLGTNLPSLYVDTASPLVPFHPGLKIEKSVVVETTGDTMLTARNATTVTMTIAAMYPLLRLDRIGGTSS
jgi:hypothetical protein